jgi:hypothetical protein
LALSVERKIQAKIEEICDAMVVNGDFSSVVYDLRAYNIQQGAPVSGKAALAVDYSPVEMTDALGRREVIFQVIFGFRVWFDATTDEVSRAQMRAVTGPAEQAIFNAVYANNTWGDNAIHTTPGTKDPWKDSERELFRNESVSEYAYQILFYTKPGDLTATL